MAALAGNSQHIAAYPKRCSRSATENTVRHGTQSGSPGTACGIRIKSPLFVQLNPSANRLLPWISVPSVADLNDPSLSTDFTDKSRTREGSWPIKTGCNHLPTARRQPGFPVLVQA